jgi:hypothetical protein
MNCLVVDARRERRAEILTSYLRDTGHQVQRHFDQLDIHADMPLPPQTWVDLIENENVVFLHIGEYQRNAPLFFAYAFPRLPIFCYTGTAPPADIAQRCGTPGSHVLCPVDIGADEDSGHRLVAVVSRWLGCIESRNDAERFVDAWHRVRDVDAEKEKRLKRLESDLCRALRKSNWTPTQVVDDQLRGLLKPVMDLRNEWGI